MGKSRDTKKDTKKKATKTLKEKEQKAELIELLEQETGSEIVGVIGHTTIFYRQQSDPEKRKISLPQR